MILQSVAHGHAVISVQINYRLGVFGFAQSDALKQECSENAGLRDHRLALEWVQRNIAAFGGDPHNVLIHGQSSGGLAIGMQMMANGASKPQPFHKAIGQSRILEGGITATFTRDAMQAVVDYTKCNTTLQGWHKANFEDENYGIYIVGGPKEGYGGVNGSHAAREALKEQKLKERCGFLISPEIVGQQEY
ncbi:Carboxylic ester hydrolase [Cercospora zeina]